MKKTPLPKKLLLLSAISICLLSNVFAQVSTYTFSQSTGAYTAISGGTVLKAQNCFATPDTNIANVAIGFNFVFNGTTYTTCGVNLDGFIWFGTGTPGTAGTPISAVGGTGTIAMVASPLGRNLNGRTGTNCSEISALTTGTSGSQVCTIQYKNLRSSSGSAAASVLNFQVKLYEASNVIQFVYGTCTLGTSTSTIYPQVGLRGANNTDFNNRTSTTSWASTTAGTANNSTITLTPTVVPDSGRAFTWTPPVPCSDPPTAGAAVSNNLLVCSGGSFSLSLSGNSTGTGQTYQWQSSPDDITFSNIAAATASTYNGTETAATYYHCVVTCGGSSVNSSSVLVDLKPANLCYCTPASTNTNCTNSGYIDSVRIVSTTLANGSTCASNAGTAWSAYAAAGITTASIQKGLAYTFEVSVSTTGNTISAWIDYNQNGAFEVTEWTQISASATAGVLASKSITIPASALNGLTGMRIRTRGAGGANAGIDACTQFGSGETEDYLITIIPPVPCNDPATAGTALANIVQACPGAIVNLSLAGNSTGIGQHYQWQYSNDGTTWFDMLNDTATTATDTLQTTIYYHCNVTCNAGTTVASGAATVTANPAYLCYCTPASTNAACANAAGYIDSVSINTLQNSSVCDETSGTAYTSYIATVNPTTVLHTDSTYTLAVRTTGVNKISVWIDYDQNGVFDTYEWTQVTASSTANVVASIPLTIPNTALPGQTAMRIRTRGAAGANAAIDACTQFASGETEDYLITIDTAFYPFVDMAEVMFVSPVAGGCYSNNETVTVRIKNLGNVPIDLSLNNVTMKSIVTGPFGASANTTSNSGILVPGATKDTVLTNLFNMSQSGVYNFISYFTFVSGDINQLNDTTRKQITVNMPNVTASNDTAICSGTGGLTLTANSSSPGATYSWSSGDPTASTFVTPTQTTTYTVTLTDGLGCVAIDSATVTVNTTPVANAGTDTTICNGTTIQLAASGGGTYLWDHGLGTGAIHSITPTSTTTYKVTVSNGGCSSFDLITINVDYPPVIDVSNIVITQTGCATPTGSITGITATGTGALTYTWENANNTTVGNAADLTAIAAGVYTLTISDATNCPASTTGYAITNTGAPAAPGATSPAATCQGQTVTDLTATTSAGGTITWYSDAALTTPVGTGSPYTSGITSTTTLYVTETSSSCESPATAVTVTVNDSVTSAGFTSNTTNGLTVSFTSTSTGASSYLWDFGDGSGTSTLANPTYTYAANGLYTVTLTVSNNCNNNVSSQSVDLTTVGIAQTDAVSDLTVYPNPTNALIHVAFHATSSKTLVIKLTNVNGQVIFAETQDLFNGNYQKTVDLSTYSKGMYFLQIISDKTNVTKKISLQ